MPFSDTSCHYGRHYVTKSDPFTLSATGGMVTGAIDSGYAPDDADNDVDYWNFVAPTETPSFFDREA